MVNRYAGTCACGRRVDVEAGEVRNIAGKWTTFCVVCANPDGVPTVPVSRTLQVDGTVQMPYDADAIIVLKGAPKARWNPQLKVWTVSVADEDLIRTLEVATKIGLTVPQELTDRVAQLAAKALSVVPDALAKRLYPFQRDGVAWLANREKALLGDDMGCGKTVQVLSACAAPETAVLVVCPASLKYNWAAETMKWLGRTAIVLSGRGSFQVPQPGEVVIINYDILPKKEAELAAFDLSNVTLVLDEVTVVKNYKAQRTQAVTALTAKCKRVWALTGTPLMGKPFDLYGVLSALDMSRAVFGGWQGFLRCFQGGKDQWGGYSFMGPLPEVPERLRRVMLRRTKEEVLPDLPSITRQFIPVNGLSKSLTKKLDSLWMDLEEEMEEGDLPPFNMLSEIRAELARERIPAMLEIVEQYEEAAVPLVVFSAFRSPIDTLATREGWVVITGDTKSSERQTIVEGFQAGQYKGIGLTIAAGGVGITLTHAADELFVDRDWTPAMNSQAEDRLRRIGQNSSAINVKILTSMHPLDKRINAVLEEKRELIQAAVENESTYDAVAVKTKAYADMEAKLKAYEEALKSPASTIAKDALTQSWQQRKAAQFVNTLTQRHELKTRHFTEEEKQQILNAYSNLLAVCDGAFTQDGKGFNKADQYISRVLYPEMQTHPSEELFTAARHLLVKYRGQVGSLPEGTPVKEHTCPTL